MFNFYEKKLKHRLLYFKMFDKAFIHVVMIIQSFFSKKSRKVILLFALEAYTGVLMWACSASNFIFILPSLQKINLFEVPFTSTTLDNRILSQWFLTQIVIIDWNRAWTVSKVKNGLTVQYSWQIINNYLYQCIMVIKIQTKAKVQIEKLRRQSNIRNLAFKNEKICFKFIDLVLPQEREGFKHYIKKRTLVLK